MPAGCQTKDGAALLAEFLATANEPQSLLAGLKRDDAQVEFLFVNVPEPRLGFDGVVEAVVNALEAAGHTLDRYSLPWMQHPDKGSALCQESLPGVALFIGSPKPIHNPRRLLLLYLIGESPTAGIYRPAFLRAMQEMTTLRSQLPPDRLRGSANVRLLGPAFSGAVASLEQVLEHPAVRDLPFTILSGRATDAAIRPLLERHSRPDRPLSYRATVIPDEALQTEFFCYLTETLGADDHDIALLTESSTVFGQAAAAPPGFLAEMAATGALLRKSEHCQHPHRPRLVLPVPLHISRLNAVWAARQLAALKAAEKQPDPLTNFAESPARALPKLLDIVSSDRTDVIPTLSPATVVSTDRSLATILSTIAAERVRYVGLIFTDVQDTLFLAEQIRKSSPDVVLFTFESDLLYAHPDARPVLKGMLSVSTYPLFTRNQQWSFPFRGYSHRLQFMRDADQGVYNAGVALLDRPELLIEYSPPLGQGKRLSHHRPPIWVSAVGIETLFPLVYIKDYKEAGYVYQSPDVEQADKRYTPYQQGTLNVLLLALGILGVIIAAGYFRCYYTPPSEELAYPWALFRLFRRPAQLGAASPFGAQEKQRQPIFALAIFLPMALLYPFFTTVHFVQLRDGNANLDIETTLSSLPLWLQLLHHSGHIGIYEGLTFRVLAVGLCASACQLVFLITSGDVLLWCLGRGHRLRSFIKRLRMRRPRLFLSVLLALFFIGVYAHFRGYVAIVNRLQGDFNNLVFMRRAAHPAFGLSPLTPLLILISALQLWGYCHLQRIRLLDKLAAVFFDFILDLEQEAPLRGPIAGIARQLESPGLWVHILSGAAVVVLVMSLFADVVSLEHYPLNFVFRLIFAVLCVLITYAAYRFLRIWLHFSRFLELIAYHPLGQALMRMPDALSRSIGSLFLEELPEQVRQEAEQSHLRLLRNHFEQFDLEHQLGKLAPADAEMLRPLFAELRAALSATAEPLPFFKWAAQRKEQPTRLLMRILKAFWHARPLPGTLPAPDSVPLHQSTAAVYARALPPEMALWLRLAEDFVAIEVVAYIHRLFPHLRNTLVFFTGALLLMLAALVTYPFQPQHFLSLLLWTFVLGTVGVTVMVFIQMNRNETLSRLARTEPGQVSFDRRFVSQIVIYGILPLLSLLAAQFPEVRGVAFSWLESILKTLK